jgi:hypothetical protein
LYSNIKTNYTCRNIVVLEDNLFVITIIQYNNTIINHISNRYLIVQHNGTLIIQKFVESLQEPVNFMDIQELTSFRKYLLKMSNLVIIIVDVTRYTMRVKVKAVLQTEFEIQLDILGSNIYCH